MPLVEHCEFPRFHDRHEIEIHDRNPNPRTGQADALPDADDLDQDDDVESE
jgi:hypothetical protein